MNDGLTKEAHEFHVQKWFLSLFILILIVSTACSNHHYTSQTPAWYGTGFNPYLTLDAQGNPWISYTNSYVTGGQISQVNIAYKTNNLWSILPITMTTHNSYAGINKLFINNQGMPVLVYFDRYLQNYKILTLNQNVWTSRQFTSSSCGTCGLQWGGMSKTLPPTIIDNGGELWFGTSCGVATINGGMPVCYYLDTPPGTEGYLINDTYGNPVVGLLNNNNLDIVSFTNTSGNWISTITYTSLDFTSACAAWTATTNSTDEWSGNTALTLDSQNNPVFVNQGRMIQTSSNMCASSFTNNTWNTDYYQWQSFLYQDQIAVNYSDVQVGDSNTLWLFYSPYISAFGPSGPPPVHFEWETMISIENNTLHKIFVPYNLDPQSSLLGYWPHNIVVAPSGIVNIAYTTCDANTIKCSLRFATYNPATGAWTDELVAQ